MKHFSTLPTPIFLLFFVLASYARCAHAQTAERRTSIGFNGSVLQYKGDFGSEYWDFSKKRYAPGLAVNQYLTKGIDLNAQLFYGQLTGQRSADYFTTTLVNANLGFKFKLNNGWALKEKFPVQPYLLASSGWTFASRTGLSDGVRINAEKGYVDVVAGAGINIRLGGVLGLFVQSSQHLPMFADLDGMTAGKPPRWADRFLQHTVGLTFNLGQAPDEDEDGVPDRLDQCPKTPADIEVDEHGCPLDDDKDGVPNYQDQCPSIPGKAEVHGCPDKDNDGVDDVDDACPDVAGLPELHGCPDTDHDGISDSEDTCPDTPAGTEVDAHGCPVSVVAPDSVAQTTSANKGTSTDTDGDGVPNTEDRCPDRAGSAANHGCPEIQASTRQRLREATKLIGFERNNAVLLPASYPTLDTIVNILNQYPDYSLSIAGHTDSQGPAAFNLRLSRDRAASARRYLLEHGVADKRVEWRGYGPKYPLASNTTEAGRARNRRVEFDLFLTGDTNAAQAKYGAETTAKPAATPSKRKPAPTKKKPISKKAVGKPRPASKTTKSRSIKSPRKAPAKVSKQPLLEW